MEKLLLNAEEKTQYKITFITDKQPVYAFIKDVDDTFLYLIFGDGTPLFINKNNIDTIIPSKNERLIK